MDTRNWHRGGAVAALTAALAACGGGGGGTPDPAATPTAQGLALSGTAATGVALAGRPVDARCSTGSGSTTTGADGSYSVTIAGAALPCAMRVTLTDGTALHGLATGGGGGGTSARANLTPATQLVVAHLAGLDPAAYYGSFDATAALYCRSTRARRSMTRLISGSASHTLRSRSVAIWAT